MRSRIVKPPSLNGIVAENRAKLKRHIAPSGGAAQYQFMGLFAADAATINGDTLATLDVDTLLSTSGLNFWRYTAGFTVEADMETVTVANAGVYDLSFWMHPNNYVQLDQPTGAAWGVSDAATMMQQPDFTWGDGNIAGDVFEQTPSMPVNLLAGAELQMYAYSLAGAVTSGDLFVFALATYLGPLPTFVGGS